MLGSRRSFLLSGLGARLLAQAGRGAAFPGAVRRYADPMTEFDVYLLTDPAHTSLLPAYYNRAITKNSATLLFTSDRPGSTQAFRMDLKNAADAATDRDGEISTQLRSRSRRTTGRSATSPGARSAIAKCATLRDREAVRDPRRLGALPGHERRAGRHARHLRRAKGRDVAPAHGDAGARDGAHRGRGAVRHERPDPPADARADPLSPRREGLWLVNSDGAQNRQLKLPAGGVGPANWAPDGKTLLYLNFPEDPTQLNTIREQTPDTNTDKLVAKTSQFAHFGFNHDTSVFVGASRNVSSPALLLLLRVTRREFTLCRAQGEQRRAGGAAILARQPARLLPDRPARQAGDLRHARGEAGGEDRSGGIGKGQAVGSSSSHAGLTLPRRPV